MAPAPAQQCHTAAVVGPCVDARRSDRFLIITQLLLRHPATVLRRQRGATFTQTRPRRLLCSTSPPSDPRCYVGERDYRDLDRFPLQKLRHPRSPGGTFARHPHHCGRPNHQQSSQVANNLFGDPAKPFLAAGAVCSRRKTQPSCELAPGSEQGCVEHRRSYSGRRYRTNTLYHSEPSARLA